MNLLGLSPLAFAIGAVLLAAGVAALHLLRVRLRQVDVDTLLFFRLAGAVRQPRVLPGKPSRWLAFLLALLAVLAGWSAFADPHGSAAQPSRVVVVEPATGAVREARLLAAEELCGGQGLGPRGAVIAAGSAPSVILRAGEPQNALKVRAAALPEAGSASGSAAALRAAQDLLGKGDEIVWIGAVPPAVGGDVPVRVLERGAAATVGLTELRWQRGEKGTSLVCSLDATAAGRAVLLGDQGEAGNAPFAAGRSEVTLGPVAAAAALRLRLEAAGTATELALPDANEPPLRVHVAKDVPAEVAQALAAVLAVDAEFAAADVGVAEVLVTGTDSDDRRPCLVVEPGVGSGPRQALLRDSPVALSLRDRTRRNAPALPVRAGDTVWVEDSSQGGALAKAERGDRLRVRIVDWLLQPSSHADVPMLLAGALRVLGGRPRELLVPAGQPLSVHTGWADAAVTASGTGNAALLPADCALTANCSTPGVMTLATAAGKVNVHVLAVTTASDGHNADAPVLDGRGGDGAWMPWLLALLLIVLCCDVYLFHRGRLP